MVWTIGPSAVSKQRLKRDTNTHGFRPIDGGAPRRQELQKSMKLLQEKLKLTLNSKSFRSSFTGVTMRGRRGAEESDEEEAGFGSEQRDGSSVRNNLSCRRGAVS